MIAIKYFLQTTQCCAQAQWLNAMWIIFPIKCFRGEKSRGKVLDRRLLEVGCPQCRHVISPHSFLGTQWQSERWAGWDSVRQCLPTVLWGPWASAQMWGLNTASWSISLLGGCVSFFSGQLKWQKFTVSFLEAGSLGQGGNGWFLPGCEGDCSSLRNLLILGL